MARGSPFQRSKLSEQIAQRLTDQILDGSLPPSRALPSERELARQCGVSVGVIREALRSLAATGLLDIRHGVGSFVNPRDRWNTSTPILLLLMSEPSSVLSVHEVRTVLEVMSAERAAEMAGPEDLRALNDALTLMAEHLDHPEENVAADLDFHLALARATHNPILLSVLQPLIEPMHECMLRGTHVPAAARHALEAHRAILDAVRGHSPGRARGAMERHLQTTRQELETLADQQLRPGRWEKAAPTVVWKVE